MAATAVAAISYFYTGKFSELTHVKIRLSGWNRTTAEKKMSLQRPAAGGESGQAGFYFYQKKKGAVKS